MDAKEHSLIATETSGDDYFYPSAKSLRNPKKQGWLIKYKPGCFCDVWKRRWVVLQGGYIFKFERKDSKRPKGLPISVTETSASIERNTSDTDQYNFLGQDDTFAMFPIFHLAIGFHHGVLR
eukprot:jgi/Bigna1/145323/aug1.97_g20031